VTSDSKIVIHSFEDLWHPCIWVLHLSK
jgi:hypothetical protein